MGEFFLRISSKSFSYSKQYTQIDVYLAYVGGILKLAVTIVGFFVINYNRYDLFVTVANRLYNFDIPRKSYQTYEKVNTKILEMIDGILMKNPKKREELEKLQRMSSFFHKDIKADSYANQVQIFRTCRSVNIGNPVPNISDLDKIDPLIAESIPEMQNQQKFITYAFSEILKCKKVLTLSFRYLISRATFRYCFYNNVEVQMLDTAIKIVKKELDVV